MPGQAVPAGIKLEPMRASLTWEADAGIIRAAMENGRSRQRRRYSNQPTIYALEFAVPFDDLDAVNTYLDTYGYSHSGIRIPMTTVAGSASGQKCIDTDIRVTSNLTFAPLGADHILLRFSAELIN
jgi:uncharacterized protein Veg